MTERKRYNVGVYKLPYAQRDVAHRVITAHDDRGFYDIIGADTVDDDDTHPVGAPTTYRVELTDEEADEFRAASNARYVEEDSTAWPVAQGPTQIPREATMAYMQAPSSLTAAWHGRNVPICIMDEGTTAVVRNYMGWQLRGRAVFGGNPRPREVWPGQHHGCLCAACGVPRGGILYDALISESNGGANASSMVAAMRWAADQGVKIVSCSFGGLVADSVYLDGIDYMNARGAVLFAAAGNKSLTQLDYPAAYAASRSNVHAVLAFDEATDTLAAFSSHNDSATGGAPGVNVLGLDNAANVVVWSGTSASTPHAASICARLATSGIFTPSQAASFLKTNLRNTGQPASNQGGGAYALQTAVTAMQLFVALPTVQPPQQLSPPLPRLADDQYAGVSDFLNATADQIDNLGVGCMVRRTGVGILSNGVDTLLDWQSLDFDTSGGGMWTADDPKLVTIRATGAYLIIVQTRYMYVTTTAPYTAGQRAMRLMLNGTNPAVHTIAADKKPTSVDGEGVTVSSTVSARLVYGDQLRLSLWQNSGGTINAAGTDFGGTFLAVIYTGPV